MKHLFRESTRPRQPEMSRGGGRGRRRGGAQHEESGERWLLTYADMITLLMALFMVLFSISSVNISKVQTLQKSLRAAFSGSILPGGKSIAQQGATSTPRKAPSTAEAVALVPLAATGSGQEATTRATTQSTTSSSSSSASASISPAAIQREAAAQHEANVFAHIKHELDSYASSHGFKKSVQTTIEPRGLVIRVLTDDLLFPSGQASLDTGAHSLLGEIAQLLNVDSTHPIEVDGNTDNVPIHSAQFPSNWELSTARASTVVQYLVERGVVARRLSATGYAEQRPIATEATAAGRARNRRVEIVMKRIFGAEGEP
jgi:chemotaxis protein MotB